MRRVVSCALLLVCSAAMADETPSAPLVPQGSVASESDGSGSSGGEHWSVLSGRTVGAGTLAIHPEFGWPGLSASLLYGATPRFDVGGEFTFNYGYEGQVIVVPGLKFQAVFRLNLYDNGRINMGLRFDPGIGLYFFGEGVAVNIMFPLYFALGIQASDSLMVVVGMDLPMFVDVTNGYLNIPILFGPGLEFQLERNLALTFNTRFGPAIYGGSVEGVEFEFKILMGIAIRL